MRVSVLILIILTGIATVIWVVNRERTIIWETMEVEIPLIGKVNLLLANTPEKWRRGLADFSLEELKKRGIDGMLFVFPEQKVVNFWTQGLKFPISIYFLDKNKKITNSFICVDPNSDRIYSGVAKYVLEMICGRRTKGSIPQILLNQTKSFKKLNEVFKKWKSKSSKNFSLKNL